MLDLELIYGKKDEKPLDTLVSDGGFVGILRTIACVGDSLSSGEFQAYKPDGENLYVDRYEYSWGQFMARMAGVKAYNFSKGGMTAKTYMESFANGMGYWNPTLAADAYIVALGVNDLFNRKMTPGTIDDVCFEDYTKNADTFYGNYAAVLQKYRHIAPNSKLFLVTMPKKTRDYRVPELMELKVRHREILTELAEKLDGTYVVDLFEYGPEPTEELMRDLYLNGHMSPTGYVVIAKMITSYIDYIIRHNMQDFKYVGLTGYEYEKIKKTQE
ncbi:MAG: SGNH/GDSL hydrolase family protein [Clostridia bacterium]|nr:SGNH/GDSL hydrolase family protein [Clostridia bacterium]